MRREKKKWEAKKRSQKPKNASNAGYHSTRDLDMFLTTFQWLPCKLDSNTKEKWEAELSSVTFTLTTPPVMNLVFDWSVETEPAKSCQKLIKGSVPERRTVIRILKSLSTHWRNISVNWEIINKITYYKKKTHFVQLANVWHVTMYVNKSGLFLWPDEQTWPCEQLEVGE